MPIPTKPSISGFIRFDPELTYTKDNVARFSAGVFLIESFMECVFVWV